MLLLHICIYKGKRPSVNRHRSILAVIFADVCSIYCASYTLILSKSRSIESKCDWKVKQLIAVSVTASEDSQYPARKSAQRRIQGHHHNAPTHHTLPSSIPWKTFNSMLSELCWGKVTPTSILISRCQSLIRSVKPALFWWRLTGLALDLNTHTHRYTQTRTSVLFSKTVKRPSEDGVVHSAGVNEWRKAQDASTLVTVHQLSTVNQEVLQVVLCSYWLDVCSYFLH